MRQNDAMKNRNFYLKLTLNFDDNLKERQSNYLEGHYKQVER